MADEPLHKWKIETADRYSKVVGSVMSKATGGLVLPALFLRQFLGIPTEKALLPFLSCAAYTAWIGFGSSILFALLYSWISVKWIKLAWGQKVAVSERRLEQVLDGVFCLMAMSFLVGIVASVWFFVNVRPARA